MNTHITHWVTLAALSTLLAACGGSGSSETGSSSESKSTGLFELSGVFDERSLTELPKIKDGVRLSWEVVEGEEFATAEQGDGGVYQLKTTDVMYDQEALLQADLGDHKEYFSVLIREVDEEQLPDAKPDDGSLAGVDINNNTIRDDVERALYKEYGADNEVYKLSLLAGYISQVEMLSGSTPKQEDNYKAFHLQPKIVACLDQFTDLDYDELSRLFRLARTLTINTKERLDASRAYIQWTQGRASTVVQMEKEKCSLEMMK